MVNSIGSLTVHDLPVGAWIYPCIAFHTETCPQGTSTHKASFQQGCQSNQHSTHTHPTANHDILHACLTRERASCEQKGWLVWGRDHHRQQYLPHCQPRHSRVPSCMPQVKRETSCMSADDKGEGIVWPRIRPDRARSGGPGDRARAKNSLILTNRPKRICTL